jgi:hypothetical protein
MLPNGKLPTSTYDEQLAKRFKVADLTIRDH